MGGKPSDADKAKNIGVWGQFDPFHEGDAAKFAWAGGTKEQYEGMTPEQKAAWVTGLGGGDGGWSGSNDPGSGGWRTHAKEFVAGLGHGGPPAGPSAPGTPGGAGGAGGGNLNGYEAAATPGTSGPWGSQGWTKDPVTGQMVQSTNLDPQMGQANSQLQSQYAEALNRPLSGEAARNQAIDAAYSQSTSRLDPAWDKRQEALRTQLLNQGLDPSSEAGRESMRESNLSRNDAYTSAMHAAQLAGDSAGNSLFNNQLAARNAPLNQMQMMRQLAQGGNHPELLSAYIAQKNNEMGLAGRAQDNQADVASAIAQASGPAIKALQQAGQSWNQGNTGPIGYDASGTPYYSAPSDWDLPQF